MSQLETNKTSYYLEKWNVDISTAGRKITIPELLIQKASYLLNEGYHVIEDSALLPPYQRQGWYIVYGKEDTTVEICLSDWRDAPYSYSIKINNKKVFEGTITPQKDMYQLVGHLVYALKEWL
jgi:hypothetical protein